MSNELKKSLSPFKLWGIIVGMVISGMYFGWNYALQSTSPVGFIIATLIVTLFYTTFIFSYAELSTSIPHAGGPSEYASRAMGRFGGFIAGFSCLVEFLFATPAIALSIGAYIHFILPGIPAVAAAVACYGIFVIINCLGVETAAAVELVVTMVAIAGLILFNGIGIVHIHTSNITSGPLFKGGLKGILSAIPFAIWFYLAVEGGAMAAEECKNPKKDIPRGFILAIGTLVILALTTLIITTGITDISSLAKTDSPLPAALDGVFGKGNLLSKGISFIGLFGLIASLHGIIIGYSRQTFAMSRAGYLPKFLSRTDEKGTPIAGIILPSLIGMVFVLTGATSTIIVISCFGAIMLYLTSLTSLFLLRRNKPSMERPFKVAYPVVPGIAFVIALVFLIATTMANVSTVSWVIGAFGVAIIYYFVYGRLNSNINSVNKKAS